MGWVDTARFLSKWPAGRLASANGVMTAASKLGLLTLGVGGVTIIGKSRRRIKATSQGVSEPNIKNMHS